MQNSKKRGGLKIALIVLAAAILTSLFTVLLARAYLFPKAFRPVALSAPEEKVLDTKIKAMTAHQGERSAGAGKVPGDKGGKQDATGELTPERYSENDAQREINLTEREVNGLLARNTDLAQRLAIDLSDDLASAKLLIPLDPEFPFIGGKVLKVTAGVELRYANQKPVVIVKGVSIWGVPMPNAWLGGIKNIDLVSELGVGQGFWRSFADGVDDIRIKEGQLAIRLKP